MVRVGAGEADSGRAVREAVRGGQPRGGGGGPGRSDFRAACGLRQRALHARWPSTVACSSTRLIMG